TTLPGAEGRIQSTIDSSNRWAKCAREHGFPETKDATREVWGALLPSHIDETRLRQLLVECPVTLDEAAERRNQELTEEFYRDDPNRQGGPEGLEMAPAVKFDYPGFNGTEGLGQDDPTTQRLAKLTTIIDESHGQAQGDQPLPG
ncbi:MAG: hypothetical protein LBS56_00595, partial [Propionibacteriaceae bacterium]|nr:hypothetical protein [Propionibacteriaceae bacterium]